MQRAMLKSKIHRATVTDCDMKVNEILNIDREVATLLSGASTTA